MIGLGQAEWFTTNLQKHWTKLDWSKTNQVILDLTEERYMDLKRLYYKAFVSNDTTAKMRLDSELFKLGVLN